MLDERGTGRLQVTDAAQLSSVPQRDRLVDVAVQRSIALLETLVRRGLSERAELGPEQVEEAIDEWYDLLLCADDADSGIADRPFLHGPVLADELSLIAAVFHVVDPDTCSWSDVLDTMLRESWDDLISIGTENGWSPDRMTRAYWDGKETVWAMEFGLPPDASETDVYVALRASTLQKIADAARLRAEAEALERRNEETRSERDAARAQLRETMQLPAHADLDAMLDKLLRIVDYFRERMSEAVGRASTEITDEDLMVFATEQPDLVRGWREVLTAKGFEEKAPEGDDEAEEDFDNS